MIRRSNQSFMKRANHGLFLFFRPFLNTISIIPIEKSIGGVLEIRTRGRVMIGADDTPELCEACLLNDILPLSLHLLT